VKNPPELRPRGIFLYMKKEKGLPMRESRSVGRRMAAPVIVRHLFNEEPSQSAGFFVCVEENKAHVLMV
ncbi:MULTISPECIES: hypothetical protein, partial [unclassified Halomonas]|uniref:hypothetical protein n=1 Tax=unclassified Halomonas TaxID=2609666 RepID=UPI0040342195